MSDSPFMPGWAWGLTAVLVAGGAILMALPEDQSRPRIKGRGYRGLNRIRCRGGSCSLGGFGEDQGCTTIAAMPKRKHITGEPGTWRTEYRVCCQPGRVTLERRRADFDADGREIDRQGNGSWHLLEKGGNESEALRFSESSYEQASSLHPIHSEHLDHIRRTRQAWRLRTEAEGIMANGGPVSDLRRKSEYQYSNELKKAKLYSKAAKGVAPPDKILAIKNKVRAAYELKLPAAKDEEKRLKGVIREATAAEKAKFRPSSRVCG